MQQQSSSHTYLEEEINLRKEITKYLRYWPWFILSLLLTIGAASIYLRYTPQSYQTTASILIKDEGNSSMSQLAAFQDLGLASNFSSVNLENEIEVLTSRMLTKRVVNQLQLNISYFNDGRLRTNELFDALPFRLEVLTDEAKWLGSLPDLLITPISFTEFKINHEDEAPETFEFGEEFTYKNMDYKLQVSDLIEKDITTRVRIRKIDATTDIVRRRLNISAQGKQSSVIKITEVSTLPEKSQAIIDELVHQFNRDAIEDKNMVSKNTADFIDDRLQIVWSELDSVETSKVAYKEENRLVDLQAEGGLFLENASEFNKRLLEAQTELSQINAMITYLEAGGQADLLPANIGIGEGGLLHMIQQYNQLVLERNQMLVSTTETHPTVVKLTEQLSGLKSNVLQSLRNIKASLDIKLKDLESQEKLIGSQLASIPLKEKDFTTIERQQEIKQSLYLYLLQKREETSIALAVTEPKAKIVDTAYTPVKAVAPKKSVILLASFILGILLPFGSIYLSHLLDNKVRSRKDILNAIPNASVLGEIPKLNSNEAKSLIKKNDLGIMAESFRVLRTNLQFAGILSKKKSAKTILITSSIKGEGKTLTSANLATTIAYAGNKVLLIGADVRNPQLPKFFSNKTKKNQEGLVEYLVYEDTKLADYITTSKVSENLNILHSGAIPPNPSELLMSKRVEDVLEEAKEIYDYIILDSAPSLLVTDTLLFSELVDATLYVIRAGYTEKQILEFAKELKQEEKLKRVNFVLNDISQMNYGYGGKYGYGYGYHSEKKSTWERIRVVMFGGRF